MGLGAFDVDGDGHTELIVPRWAHVSAYRLSDQDGRVQLERVARVSWPAMPARFPRPRRAQALVYVEGGRLLVSRTDRDGAVALRWDVEANAWVTEVVTPFVGRVDELTKLRSVLEDTILQRTAHMVSVVGSPGVDLNGKQDVGAAYVYQYEYVPISGKYEWLHKEKLEEAKRLDYERRLRKQEKQKEKEGEQEEQP